MCIEKHASVYIIYELSNELFLKVIQHWNKQ